MIKRQLPRLTTLALVVLAACSSSKERDHLAAGNPSGVDTDTPQEMNLPEVFTKVNQWKDLVFVGVPAPSFQAFSEKSRQYFSNRAPPGKFYVYFHHSDMPLVCLDKDCGDIAKAVNAKGGRFMGFSDPKAVESLGILKQGKQGFEVSPSLVVVADSKAVVKAIFIHASTGDLDRILKESGF